MLIWKAKDPNNQSSFVPTVSKDEEEENILDLELPSVEVEQAPVIKKQKVAVSNFNVDEYSEIFAGIKLMSDEDKSLIVGFDEETNTFLYKNNITVAECPCCKEKGVPCPEGQDGNEIPDEIMVCPYCGTNFTD